MSEVLDVLPTSLEQRRFSVLVRPVPTSGVRRVIVALRGEVDAEAVPALTRLQAQLARWGAPVTVITSRVTFMDSAGLAAVLALDPHDACPQLPAPSHPVQLVLGVAASHPAAFAPSIPRSTPVTPDAPRTTGLSSVDADIPRGRS